MAAEPPRAGLGTLRRREVLVLAVLFLAGIAQGWRFRPYDRAVLADDQLYFYVAERAASGVPPHVSLVDHKHQLSGLISGAAIAIGRTFGADDVMAARVPSIAAAAAVPPLLFLLVEALTSSFAAGLAAGVCALTFHMFFVEAATGFRPQLFMMFFGVAALLAYARGRLAFAGALSACTFLCWQPAAAFGAAIIVAALFGPRPLVSAVRVALAGIVVLLCYEAYFVAHGALAEQLYQSYLLGRGWRPRPLGDTLHFIWRGDPTEQWLRPDAVFSIALLIGLACLAAWLLVRPQPALAAWKRSAAWRAVLIAALGALAFTALDHQAYPDRFFVLPYVAVATGVAVALVPARLRGVPLRGLWCTALCAWMLTYAPYVVARGKTEGALERQRALAHELARIADARGGGLWVIGRPDLLAFERRDNWNSFGMLLDEHVRAYALRKSRARPNYRPVRDGKMPDMVVAARISVRRNLPWLLREYDKVELPEFQNPSLFVRKQDAVAARAAAPTACGDPVGDRFVTGATDVGRPPMATDALYLLRAALSHHGCAPCVCDIDGSGAVNASDALRLLKIAGGAQLALECPACAPRAARPPAQRARPARRPAGTSSTDGQAIATLMTPSRRLRNMS